MYQGGCLCGKVRYEVDQFAASPVHCHCQTCRKRQGAVMSTNAPVLNEHFRVVKGQSHLSAFESSAGKYGYFCKHCGSHLYAKRQNTEAVVLRLGCIDDNIVLPQPEAHIWRSDSASWYDPKTGLIELATGRKAK